MSATEHRRVRVPGAVDYRAMPAFYPPAMTGCVLWLSTEGGLWKDSGMTSPAENNGDAVYTWQDLSGNGNHFTQPTAANRPILCLNKTGDIDTLQFDGNDWLELSRAIHGELSATAFIVAYLSSASQTGAMFGVGTDGNGWKVGTGASSFDNSGNDLILLLDGVKWIDTTDPIGTGLHLITVRLSTGEPSWWIDGDAMGNTTGTPRPPTSLTSIGRDGANRRYYNDNLAEILASDRSLSDAELQLAHDYLLGKYGL